MVDTLRVPHVGEYVQDTLGHYLRIVTVLSPFTFRVQALTPVDPPGTLVPIGAPFVVGRSDLRLTRY